MLVLTLHLLTNNAQRTAYWVMFAHPKVYEYTRVLFSYPLVEETFHVVDGILRNTAIVSFGVDGTAALLGSDKWVAQIICGTLAGCGGGIWMGNNWNQQFDHSMLSASHNINQCTQIYIRCIPFDTSSVVLFNTSSVASLVSGHESDFCGGSLLVVATQSGFNSPAQAEVFNNILLCSGLVYGIRKSRKEDQKLMKQKKQ